MVPHLRVPILWALCAVSLSLPPYFFARADLPPPRIHIRWASSLAPDEIASLERRFHLTNGEHREGRTWTYRVTNVSRTNLGAIVRDPRVEDTYGIDRSALRAVDAPGAFHGAGVALLIGAAASILLIGGLAKRRALRDSLTRCLPAAFLHESRWASLGLMTTVVAIAIAVKAPSWMAIAWDDEDLLMSVLTTTLHARYWEQGIWVPLWNGFQGFGVPHPSPTHLIYSPLFPLMLLLNDDVALSVHYSVMAAIGAVSMFALSRTLGASPLLAAVGAVSWVSSSYFTQLYFVDFWTLTFTSANLAVLLITLVLKLEPAGAGRSSMRDTLTLGLTGGMVLSCSTPAGSGPFGLVLAVLAACSGRLSNLRTLGRLLVATAIAFAVYAPVIVTLWQELRRFTAPRRYTLNTGPWEMAWAALMWPLDGNPRAVGFGAPVIATVVLSLVAVVRPPRLMTHLHALQPVAVTVAVCLGMYLLPVSMFPLPSGNGTWGLLFTMFAIPFAMASLTIFYRHGSDRVRLGVTALVVAQLILFTFWSASWWSSQVHQAEEPSVGRLLAQPSALERALLERVAPARDRVLLSPLAEESLLRGLRGGGHSTNFARLGIPVVNGAFKFISYHNAYPDSDATWGTILTRDERPTPQILDVAGVSFLVTLQHEVVDDGSMRHVGRYLGHGPLWFDVWHNVDVWPRASFVEPVAGIGTQIETGTVIWRRRSLPTRSPEAVSHRVPRPGIMQIRFDPAPVDRQLLVSEVTRRDLMTVHGARLTDDGLLADVFTVMTVPAGSRSVQISWENPLRRGLWRLSYATLALGAIGMLVGVWRTHRSARGSPLGTERATRGWRALR